MKNSVRGELFKYIHAFSKDITSEEDLTWGPSY